MWICLEAVRLEGVAVLLVGWNGGSLSLGRRSLARQSPSLLLLLLLDPGSPPLADRRLHATYKNKPALSLHTITTPINAN